MAKLYSVEVFQGCSAPIFLRTAYEGSDEEKYKRCINGIKKSYQQKGFSHIDTYKDGTLHLFNKKWKMGESKDALDIVIKPIINNI